MNNNEKIKEKKKISVIRAVITMVVVNVSVVRAGESNDSGGDI